jgi:hypothetical protein
VKGKMMNYQWSVARDVAESVLIRYALIVLAVVLALAALVGVMLFHSDDALGGANVQPTGYPPPAHAPGQAMAESVIPHVNLSPTVPEEDQIAAPIGTGQTIDTIIFVGTDSAAAPKIAADWIAKNRPDAHIINGFLPPQGPFIAMMEEMQARGKKGQ